MLRRLSPILTALLLIASPAAAQAPAAVQPADAAAFQRAADTVSTLAQAASGATGMAPGMALVMVRRGQAPVVWTHGVLAAGGEAPVTADTPFYLGGQTKAFLGLMAAKLDANGVFSLDQSLTDVWPELTLPFGADPRALTFRQLLSQQAGLDSPDLGFRTAYADIPSAADFPRLLSQGAVVVEPKFRSSNLGVLAYAAALETQTGRDWRDWLAAEVLTPAGMSRSGPSADAWPAAERPTYHQWMGEAGWSMTPGKPEALMHAGGGLSASPADLGRWLSVQLGEHPEVAAPALLAAAAAPLATAEIKELMVCQAYALGWNICRAGQVDVLAHGGSQIGARSAMAVSPDLGVGIAFVSNSGSLTAALSQALVEAFFNSVQDPAWTAPTPEAYRTYFDAGLANLVRDRARRLDARRAEDIWGGWGWTPTPADRAAYAGRYGHPVLGEVAITGGEDGALSLTYGAFSAPLEPARADLFAIRMEAADLPDPVTFERAEGGVAALEWNGRRFTRLD
jgi:CubicO group peptidase (beta-lactamase class C family)